MVGAIASSSRGMDIFTAWAKKPYTTQVEYATDELKNLYTKSLKPYMDHLEYLGMQNPTANNPGRKPDLETEYTKKIKDLVMQGANPNILESPLHYAIATDNDDLVRFLLEQGTNPNQADADGISAFNLARLHNNPEVINAFLTTQTTQPVKPGLISTTDEADVKNLLHYLKTLPGFGAPQAEVEKKATIQKMISEPQKQKLP